MRWPFRRVYLLEIALLIGALVVTQVLSAKLWMLPNGDVDEYYAYAVAFWTSHPLFHSLPAEYPPLAIIPFTLTLLPDLPNYYHQVFAVWMGALVVAGYIGFLRFAGHTRAIMYAVYLLLGTSATLLARYDIVPALATLAALWLAERGRFGYAYVFIAAGVLLKLYPAFLIPIVVIEQWRQADAQLPTGTSHSTSEAVDRRHVNLVRTATQFWQRAATQRALRGLLLCAGLVLGFLAIFYVLNPAGTLSGFLYANNRPLQVESTPASILWLGSIFGIPAYPNYSFTSLNFVGPLDVFLKPASAVALVCGCLWVYSRQARAKLTVSQAFLACLGIVLVTNKIFSPQYLIWIIPIVAYVEGLDLFWVAICFLTWCDYPIIYQLHHPIQTVPYSWQFMPVLALRNGLLLYVTLRVIIRPNRRLYHSPETPSNTETLEGGPAGTGAGDDGGGVERAALAG
ncbi:MAG: glycosyltransferase 87 family protein [Ktedonobacterales bacterium]